MILRVCVQCSQSLIMNSTKGQTLYYCYNKECQRYEIDTIWYKEQEDALQDKAIKERI
jgi:hypothetical protein